MKTRIIALALCLTALCAQAQTEYIIDQPLFGEIKKIQVFQGWNVRLVHDSVNMVSIVTPCEHYFTEGNEPELCKLDAEGWLSIWQNKYMPQGTVVEVHYSEPIDYLLLNPNATVSADTLLMGKRYNYKENELGDIDLGKRASLTAGCINGCTSLELDSNATAHVGLMRSPLPIQLSTMAGSTLTVDSFDCPDVRYNRNPKSRGNLTESNNTRNLTVKTANRWFTDGLKILRNTIGLEYNVPIGNQYNNPYAMPIELVPIVGLRTNVISINQRWGLSLGTEFGAPCQFLTNNSTRNGRTLDLDTLSPGVNRQQSMMYIYISLPTRLHYRPQTAFGKAFFADLHIGLSPRVNFYQRYTQGLLSSNNRWNNEQSKVSVYNTFQMRAEVGLGFDPFSNIAFNFYVDLLPTYRKETGMGNIHSFGFQIKF